MAAVERRELGFVQPFDDREDGRVHETNILIGVTVHHVAHAVVVIRNEILDLVRTGRHVAEEREHRTRAEPLRGEVIQLWKDGRRHDQGFGRILDQPPAPGVIAITPVERRVEGAGVEDQRHERGGWRREPFVAAVRAGADDPEPRLSGLGRNPDAFSSSASRTTSANDTPRSRACRCSRAIVASSAITVVRFIASLYNCLYQRVVFHSSQYVISDTGRRSAGLKSVPFV